MVTEALFNYQTPQKSKSIFPVIVRVCESCAFLSFPPKHSVVGLGSTALLCMQKGKREPLAGRRCRGMLSHSCIYVVSPAASTLTLVYLLALSQPALCTSK